METILHSVGRVEAELEVVVVEEMTITLHCRNMGGDKTVQIKDRISRINASYTTRQRHGMKS